MSGTVTAQSDPWSQQQKLTADDGDAFDDFGNSLTISGDGNTLLIGADDDDDQAGSAYVFTQNGGEWSQQQKLTPDDGDELDIFGVRVALSSAGETAVIGAAFDEDPNGVSAGSAYVFTQDGGEWGQQQKLTPDDGDDNDFFGRGVALSGDGEMAVIGAPQDEDPNGENAGSVYVFTQNGGEWSQQQKLAADDGNENDVFGRSLALSDDGETAIVGADDDEEPSGSQAGSAYVFTQNDGEWSQQQKLTPDDGDNRDSFGFGLAVSGNGETAVIGASGDGNQNGENAGSAYVFTQSDGDWSQQQKLVADDGDSEDLFGVTIALSRDGETAVIGAPQDEDPNGSEGGSAYVFSQNSGEWSQQQKLAADDGDEGDFFATGTTVPQGGETVVIGAPGDVNQNGESAGSAYVFSRVNDASPLSGTAGEYDADGDGTITASELGDAVTDFGQGEVTASELGEVVTAFGQS